MLVHLLWAVAANGGRDIDWRYGLELGSLRGNSSRRVSRKENDAFSVYCTFTVQFARCIVTTALLQRRDCATRFAEKPPSPAPHQGKYFLTLQLEMSIL